MQINDNGREFEQRALAVARAIHDPSGTQGSVMFRGREHDGVFVDERTVVAFEFTQLATKDKAQKDAQKVRDILQYLRSQPENRYKLIQGFVVTMNEPTAVQRKIVDQIAADAQLNIKCLSLVSLRKSLIDTEKYLALRRDAPFGSTGYKLPASTSLAAPVIESYVEPTLARASSGQLLTLDETLEIIEAGGRIVVTADFGAGKSEALRQSFERLRKRYFRAPTEHRFPLHINLRDCYGLRSPREVLWRHAEDIGFREGDSLVAAWRSGNCTLLLDGFDELVPSRWVGGARDLRQVRWQALEPIRRLVDETPLSCGVIVAGRPQYFSTEIELLESLGLRAGDVLELWDLDDDQLNAFVGRGTVLPEWVPSRPLLLKFLIQNELLNDLSHESKTAAFAWWKMLDVIAAREAERVSSVTRDSIKLLIARIATLARSGEDGLGPVTIEDMRSAFREVCGYEADEEGLQLLLRLPGLASSTIRSQNSESEVRRFVDSALAEAAYGQDLSSYIASPYSSHPLCGGVSWTSTSGRLTSGVAAVSLEKDGIEAGVTSAPIRRRLDDGYFDAVLLDVVNVADAMGARPNQNLTPFFDAVLVPELVLTGDNGYLSRSTFKDCVIEMVDVSELDSDSQIPTFQSCLIGKVDGWPQLPPQFAVNFAASEIESFSAAAQTTSGLMQLGIDAWDRIALVILKKVYAQAGNGRRESALARGLPLGDRVDVRSVTSVLESVGYVTRGAGRGEDLILPVKSKRGDVAKILAVPNSFSLATIR